MNDLKNTIANRIINAAQDLGSSATTVKGAHKYIMDRQRHPLSTYEKQPHQQWTSTRKRDFIAALKDARLLDRRLAKIRLGKQSGEEVGAAEHARFPRRKNWNSPMATVSDAADTWTNEENMGKYSSSVTFDRWEYTPAVGCYAIDRGKLGLEFHWMGQVSFLQPPAGYKWGKDRNGIRLVALNDADKDYHPDSDDLRWYSKAAVRAKANAMAMKRRESARLVREQRRQEKADLNAVKAAEKEGAMICLKDSTVAGNCETGTRNFAARHGLDPAKHYRPTELLKIANGDAKRVRLAVAVGLRRHRREMAQGFALLADHK